MKHWQQVVMPIALSVVVYASAASAITVTPKTLAFRYAPGGTSPPPQYVDVKASSRTRITVGASVSGGVSNWLNVTPSGALTTDQTLRVSANPEKLTAGTYQGTIAIWSRPGIENVAVTLTVSRSSGPTIAVSPAFLNFAATTGGATPPSQTLTVRASPRPPSQPRHPRQAAVLPG